MSAADDYDPFQAFNEAAGSVAVADPYPDFIAARAQGPVVELDPAELAEGAGISIVGDMIPPSLKLYGAMSFDAVAEVLRDGKTYSSAGYAMVMGPVMGKTILQMDEPEHSRYRKLLSTAFTKRALERWEQQLVRPIVARFIEQFRASGRADLVKDLTFPFPVYVIAGMLGLPEKDLPQFHRWAIEIISVSIDTERAMTASREIGEYFGELLKERRAHPGEDMMSRLAQAELDGAKLEDEDIFSFLRLLLPAGAETTARSSSNLLVGLLQNADQLDALRAEVAKGGSQKRSDPMSVNLMDAAIEEGLRWEAPLLGIMRISTAEREVCGVTIPAGAIVMVNLGSANRDESRWEHPERLDIFREPKPHMAFAYGPHSCMGTHLARMETRVLLEELFARCPGLRLDPDAPAPEIRGMTFRSPASIPVVFDT